MIYTLYNEKPRSGKKNYLTLLSPKKINKSDLFIPVVLPWYVVETWEYKFKVEIVPRSGPSGIFCFELGTFGTHHYEIINSQAFGEEAEPFLVQISEKVPKHRSLVFPLPVRKEWVELGYNFHVIVHRPYETRKEVRE